MSKLFTEESKDMLKRIFSHSKDGMTIKLSQINDPKLDIHDVKKFMDRAEENEWIMKNGDRYVLAIDLESIEVLDTDSDGYLDHDGTLRSIMKILRAGYRDAILIVGPAGTGKTRMVQEIATLCETEKITNGIVSLNGSEGTKERDLTGMLRIKGDNEFTFIPAAMVRAMQQGKLFYLDEANTIPPGVLMKLNEALDDRRAFTRAISENEMDDFTTHAKDGFMMIATVNPLDVIGTKSMPAQLMSRFQYRFHMDYPTDVDSEIRIVTSNTKSLDYVEGLSRIVQVIQHLRSDTISLSYRPTIRESISAHKLLLAGFDDVDALKIAVINVGYHWSKKTAEEMLNAARLQFPSLT